MLEASPNLDRMFEALADPTRRLIVERLSRGPASVSELAVPFAMSLPAVVQHLQVLEQSGLISTQKIGRTRNCTIDTGALSLVEQWINDRRVGWEKRLDRLGAFLDAQDDPAFAALVERTFARMAGERRLAELYNKWFLRRLPTGETLNLPMSPQLEEMFRMLGQPE